MDFELVLKTLMAEFSRLEIRCAVIGGFALGVLGAPRQTLDLDFLVHRDDLPKLDRSLTALGYSRVFQSENVSQYRHSEVAWGSVDFVHAFRKISLAMLDRAKDYPAFGGKQSLRTVQPEDIIGLKVQAMSNDPERRAQEQIDIEKLMGRFGNRLDWDRIQEFYDVFGIEEEAKKLRERFDHAE
ncbi:MAG: nucleotidyltransferase family protein [Deltaproteobacteria bacterium]|nr:nucleotidyltransferase family protein [Deltaproteobacteria bacterium]MDZ4342971.1 nucleotidyltransferase family protein [Candidatus Binatia bacterium]